MAVVTDFEVDKIVGMYPFTVAFTDLSTGSPDGWLWDFGDGQFSDEQHPTHIYRRLGIFTVKLTSFIIDSVVAPATIEGVIKFASIADGSGTAGTYTTFDAAQTAFTATLPFTNWTTNTQQFQYQIFDHHINNKWDYRGSHMWRNFKLSTMSAATNVVYLKLVLAGAPQYGGASFVPNHYYFDETPHGMKVGKWDGSIYDGNENTLEIDFWVYDGSTWNIIFDLEPYFGIAGEQAFAMSDAYDWEKPLKEDLPQTGGARDFKGYGTSGGGGSYQWVGYNMASPDDKDSEVKVNYITVNENVILRPPNLYSGIKEAYFKDGWKNEKYLYIEQNKAQPCTIQFIDIYAETENEE